jgi:hypothetical protein
MRFKAEIIPSPMGRDAPVETIRERDSLCADVRKEISQGNDSEGETIFPNSEGVTRNITAVLPRPDMDQSVKKFGGVVPMILTCMAYRATFSNAVHATAKVITVLRRDPITRNGLAIIPPKEGMTLAPGEFFTSPSFAAGVYAD